MKRNTFKIFFRGLSPDRPFTGLAVSCQGTGTVEASWLLLKSHNFSPLHIPILKLNIYYINSGMQFF